MRVISQRYPDIRIEGENYLPQPIYRHIASFLSVFKLVLIGLIIVGKDPFAFFGMQAPSIWQWGQENKVYACMMVFFLSNMIENQCMSTGAFEITLNGIKWWFPKAAWLRPMKACTEDSMLLVQTGCFSRSRVVPPEKKLNERPLSVLACFQILHIHGVQ
ncbi:thioredoxin reductase-like selenoprotein T isoform X4 [Calonectris borealis]